VIVDSMIVAGSPISLSQYDVAKQQNADEQMVVMALRKTVPRRQPVPVSEAIFFYG
jgi:hypothetical protein